MKKLAVVFLALLLSHAALFAQRSNEVLKVLAIGNSFSEDAIENYLYDLAKAVDQQMVIGNMYIGGAPISLHVQNARDNKKAYAYRKVSLDGTKTESKEQSLEAVIADEDWDYISLQQASPFSGQYDVIMKDLPELIAYVKAKAPGAKLIYHQTWAYQADSDHKAFVNYDKDQQKMFDAIIGVSKKISKMKDFAFLVPSGTAVQNARTSSLGDHLTRDGYHLNLQYGRFAAACTWYEKLLRLDVRKNPWKPEKVTELQANIAKQAAHKAVKKPFKVSKVKL